MQAFAEKFYKGKAWQRTRALIWSRDRGLCQDCLRRGLINPAAEVHHIIELTPANIDRPEITLNPDNLISLCKDCHAKRHHPDDHRRYIVGPTGAVEIRR
jgi:5-methylcytosine-specific restriction endonuclease McrA